MKNRTEVGLSSVRARGRQQVRSCKVLLVCVGRVGGKSVRELPEKESSGMKLFWLDKSALSKSYREVGFRRGVFGGMDLSGGKK
jgi:hypothetical protein